MTDNLAEFSAFLDTTIRARLEAMPKEELVAELLLMHRTIKVVEEMGEVVGALIGMTGANPRKGVTHTAEQLVGELHDVAVSVEGAAEHVMGNNGWWLDGLTTKVDYVHGRAGLVSLDPEVWVERVGGRRWATSYTRRVGWKFAPRPGFEQDRAKYGPLSAGSDPKETP